jgi:hypothetical protein
MRVRILSTKDHRGLTFKPQYRKLFVWHDFTFEGHDGVPGVEEFNDLKKVWEYLYSLDEWTMITSGSVATLKLPSSRSILKDLGTWVEERVNAISDKLSRSE